MLLLYNNNAFTNQKDSFYFAINIPLGLNGLAIAPQHLLVGDTLHKQIEKKRRQMQLSTLTMFTPY